MKRISREIIERIEGEAGLELTWEAGRVVDAKVKFINFRGIERILEGRHPLDALVIAPRVCGICSHAHVTAVVQALEDCYAEAGKPLVLTQKAIDIRTIVLNAEKIQNHMKWFVFSLLPELASEHPMLDSADFLKNKACVATQLAFSKALKMGAIFSGQWPHGSYAVPGGVTSDPTRRDIIEAKALLEEVDEFCKAYLFGHFSSEIVKEETKIESISPKMLLGHALEVLTRPDFAKLGRSHDRFLVLGLDNGDGAKKSLTTRIVSAEPKYVHESTRGTFFEQNGYTYGKSALYKERYYETGPIARMMIAKEPKVRELHRKYKDALVTRVAARMLELAYLITETQTLLGSLDILEPSWIKPEVSIEALDNVQGRGIIEASRGSLIHTVGLKKGAIAFYDIITPTVWNLGNGTQESPSVIQKALFGVKSVKEADLIFKGLDVCSVCTTQ